MAKNIKLTSKNAIKCLGCKKNFDNRGYGRHAKSCIEFLLLTPPKRSRSRSRPAPQLEFVNDLVEAVDDVRVDAENITFTLVFTWVLSAISFVYFAIGSLLSSAVDSFAGLFAWKTLKNIVSFAPFYFLLLVCEQLFYTICRSFLGSFFQLFDACLPL